MFFTFLQYDVAQSGETASFGQPAVEDGGRKPMGGRVSQADMPGAKAAEDGGRRPRSAGGGKEDEGAGRKTATTAGETRGRAGRGGGGPLAVADLLIWPMGGRTGQGLMEKASRRTDGYPD